MSSYESKFVTLLFTAPILEEVIFRGFIYVQLEKKLGSIWSGVLSSIAFAVIHEPIAIFGAFIFGLMAAYAYEKTRSLPFCVLIHIKANLFAVLTASLGLETDSVVSNLYLLKATLCCTAGATLFLILGHLANRSEGVAG